LATGNEAASGVYAVLGNVVSAEDETRGDEDKKGEDGEEGVHTVV
jgi:hypothetical protein